MQRALTSTEREALTRFKGALVPLLGDDLVSVRLFGSRARGDGTSESDLDVLVVLRRKDVATCRVIVEAALDVGLAYGANVAPTVLTVREYDRDRECGAAFYRNVEQDAVAL